MVRQKKATLLLAAILTMAAIFTGCQPKQEAAPAAASTQAPAQATADANSVRVIKHAMGTTEIKGTPKKVVTLFQGATDAALALGVKPVGAVEAWIEQPWYNYIKDKMNGVTNLGSENQPNLEKLVALQPDLIIGSKFRDEKIYAQLSAIAPTVMTEDIYFWKDSLKVTAEATNMKDAESKFLADWNKKVTDFKAKMGDKSKLEVGIVDFRVDHARIVYTGFSASVLEELGITRPANQRGKDWGIQLQSKENITQMDADIIFDQTANRTDGRLELRKAWSDSPLWKNLRAVKAGKVFEVNAATWNNGSGPLAAVLMIDDLYGFYGLTK
ncbi:ABC transporter substrate-binding protein [Paenibacillus planticolens]|uniref:ABC transporter substrate-binding protein n=1 Tax=Paenibacillus planticolens TaxID=2654976 RepID=A0ABX1ZXU9_9BACL|nr:iron-siderophore ABC transporter substrate-binding protein [Paenibacillus planticolens]NOV04661.1 ABC transporter substrate-binding protein [Paenibacillus planticolens]